MKKIFITVLVCCYSTICCQATNDGARLQKRLTNDFYALVGNRLFWTDTEAGRKNIKQLIEIVDSARYLGLQPNKYHLGKLKTLERNNFRPTGDVQNVDQIVTDAALAFAHDFRLGENIGATIRYDELSAKCLPTDEQQLIVELSSVTTASTLRQFLLGTEPMDQYYSLLKIELARKISANDAAKVRLLAHSLNLHRWIKHFNKADYLVVNIGPATLDYYQNDTLALHMKTVVGKPSTKTPRFVAHCDYVVLYPYWNVPESIKPEVLAHAFKNRSYLATLNYQIIDRNGKVVDPKRINWKAYSPRNFPYRIRQATGCDNALGVIKFNLTSPFGVYLHDTNMKPIFSHDKRHYSHGCIRLEKPVELGTRLTQGKIDTTLLAACEKNQEPVTVSLQTPIPVFVVYSLCSINSHNEVVFHKDIYHLLQ